MRVLQLVSSHVRVSGRARDHQVVDAGGAQVSQGQLQSGDRLSWVCSRLFLDCQVEAFELVDPPRQAGWWAGRPGPADQDYRGRIDGPDLGRPRHFECGRSICESETVNRLRRRRWFMQSRFSMHEKRVKDVPMLRGIILVVYEKCENLFAICYNMS